MEEITSQINKLITAIGGMDNGVEAAITDGLMQGSEIVAAEQRRIVSARSSTLAGLIKVGKITLTKAGKLRVSVGYDTPAIQSNPEAVIVEFGRPGKNSDGVDKLGRKIGALQPTPHIRQGFDSKIEGAAIAVERKFDEVLKQWTK